MHRLILAALIIALLYTSGCVCCSVTERFGDGNNLDVDDYTGYLDQDGGQDCTPPYIRVGTSCCLDENQNQICDKDELATTTLPASTTSIPSTSSVEEATTSTTTTTTSTTTTTTLYIECSENSDCGEYEEVRVCYNGDVYLQKKSPRCQNPGTPESRCIINTGFVGQTMFSPASPIETCRHDCEDGECVM